jgi:hypothetical protein
MAKKQLSYTIFTEKYRPDNVSGILMPTPYKNFFMKLVEEKEVPNLLLHSSYPGSGKTSLAKALCEDIGADSLYINMSEDSGIDVIRNDARRFASGKSLNKKKKIIIMDECLEENEEVRIGTLENTTNIKLKDMELGKMYDSVSFNMSTGVYENDSCMIISEQEKEVFEVELEDGRKILVTNDHPFIINECGTFVEKCITDGLVGLDVLLKED